MNWMATNPFLPPLVAAAAARFQKQPLLQTSLEALRVRLTQVERENLQLRQQRDILKKTLGIVSTT